MSEENKQLNIDELEREYNELLHKIEETREKRDEYNSVTKDIINMLKSTNEKIKQHLKKATEYRGKRDSFNEAVQEAKNNRITTQVALEELRSRLNDIKEKYKDIKPIGQEERRQIRKLESAVRKRNLEIETKPDLTVEDEDRLIKEIEKLETKLSELTQGTKAKAEYSKVIAQFPKYRAQLRKFHEEVIVNSEQSQKYHELMLKEYEAVDELREKIKTLEKELSENRKIADEYHSQLVAYYQRRDELRNIIFKTRREDRRRRSKERANVALLKRRLAKERLERGERLDFVEFRLLLDKNEITLVQEEPETEPVTSEE